MQHSHFDTLAGSILSVISLLFLWLAHIDIHLNEAASFVSIFSGIAAFFVNYPKIKKRIKEIIQKFKK